MRRKLFGIIGFALAGLAIAACGGDDNAKSTTQVTATSAASSAATSSATSGSGTTVKPANTPKASQDNSGGDTGAAGLGACAILPESRVEEVMGEAVDAGKGSDTECTWDGTTDVGLSVILSIRNGSHQDMQNYFDLPIGTTTDVSGIGDAAHWSSGVSVLEVLQGNYDFQVQLINILSSTDDATQLNQAKALATDVSGKLP